MGSEIKKEASKVTKTCQVREGSNQFGAFIDYTGSVGGFESTSTVCGKPSVTVVKLGTKKSCMCSMYLEIHQDRSKEADLLLAIDNRL
jgi:hypothetical protein